jgi:hypothetical protein
MATVSSNKPRVMLATVLSVNDSAGHVQADWLKNKRLDDLCPALPTDSSTGYFVVRVSHCVLLLADSSPW